MLLLVINGTFEPNSESILLIATFCITRWARQIEITGGFCDAKKCSGVYRPRRMRWKLRQTSDDLGATVPGLITPCDCFPVGVNQRQNLLPSYASKPARLEIAHNRNSEILIYNRGNVAECNIVWAELEYRLGICRVTNGAHIEHL